jgi:hypothetical protein
MHRAAVVKAAAVVSPNGVAVRAFERNPHDPKELDIDLAGRDDGQHFPFRRQPAAGRVYLTRAEVRPLRQ